jgi:glycogen synthase
MKIALICDWYLPRIGGLELHIRDLARELNARGHEAHVITSTPASEAAQFVGHGRHRGGGHDHFRVHRLPVKLMPGLNTIRSRAALQPLERVFKQERYDVVHCHTLLSPLSHAAAYVARRLGIPTVMTEHSVLRHYGMFALRALSTVTPYASWFDVFTAVSSFVAGDVRGSTGRDECLVLPNGIDPTEWDGHRRGPHDEELRVVSVMRMTKRKRPTDIVRAARRVLDALPAGYERPLFTFVGDGPERAPAEREAARLGLGDRVEFTGFRERSFVREILARSAVFVLPTRKEALSIASLQALSSGLPVVAMSHGGVGDIITHGREGFLADSPEEFADYIYQLVTNPTLRLRMRAAARHTVERFTWGRVIAQHVDCYRLAQLRAGTIERETPAAAVSAA